MTREIWVDVKECTGCDVCIEMCPDVFELNEDAVAVVYNRKGDSDEALEECIDACPESCLHWRG